LPPVLIWVKQPKAGHQLDGHRHVRHLRGGTLFITKWAAPRPSRRLTSTPAVVALPAFRTAWRLPATTCLPRLSWVFPAAVFANGFDGLIFSIGWLVGWPVITFLMAERLRNLGKFTFADVAAYRFAQTPVRIFAASGTLVVVAFYMIAQMVGAGQLIKVLFGMEYSTRKSWSVP
jgi:cation/acetate symporter